MRTALLCLFAVLLTTNICQSIANPCVCLKISNIRVPAARIKDYFLQKSGLCHITAYVLKTMQGKTFCVDPKTPWVINAINSVEAKRRTTARPMPSASKLTLNTRDGS